MNITIGDKIRYIRQDLGDSQADFGKRLGVDSSTISRWEKNKVSPPKKKITMIAELGEVTADYLVNGIREPRPAAYYNLMAKDKNIGSKNKAELNDYIFDLSAGSRLNDEVIKNDTYQAVKKLMTNHNEKLSSYSIESQESLLYTIKLIDKFRNTSSEVDGSSFLASLLGSLLNYVENPSKKNDDAANVSFNMLLKDIKDNNAKIK